MPAPMEVQARCAACGWEVEVSENYKGKNFLCTDCRKPHPGHVSQPQPQPSWVQWQPQARVQARAVAQFPQQPQGYWVQPPQQQGYWVRW